ncbi:hypothetical protein F3J23_00750 [Chryseobacterium sp. Tr-659]|uniref:hypothetical protein n=1 Tax=Chryseobacterium sp. Tr-659 TaxID=2608340 RepID=UPI00141DD86A|nr:hypothetical protein [Chryseobacterium sp. Tr-659]NIF03954.1 hypothetical protein [Chryseobacterium sp. Tr-659]
MKKIISVLLMLFSSFLLSFCSGPVPASTITDVSQIQAEIEIYQSLSNQQDNIVSVILYDKNGKRIGSDAITIWVNQQKVEYKIIHDISYALNYYYRIENVVPKNGQYKLEMQLANGKKFFLGSVPTLKLSNPKKIIANDPASLDKDFTIHWSELHDVNMLYVYKSLELENKQDKNVQTFIEEASDTIRISPDGNYSVKKEQLSRPHEKLSIMSFKFTAEKTGNLNPLLLKESTINIDGYHEKRISFK